ncbi:MAG: FG-GAP repeat domain-containing protein, partial [Myxococcota bacterium]
ADGDVTTEADAVLWSGDPGAAAGSAVAVGDADGDGVADVLAGGPDGGAAWLWTGPLAGSLDDGSAALVVSEASSDAGAATALCDLDGDGLADVIVGVPGYDYRSTDNGIAGWVYAPGPGGTLAIGDLDGWVYGTYRGSLGGTALACAGDVDGDGLDDVLAGAPGATGGASGSGVAYLVAAPPTGASTMAATTYWQGGVRYDEAGAEVAAAGDVDGDGRQDVWVGAPGYDGEAGAAWLFLGSATGALVEDDARTVVRGDVAGGRLGEALAAGDLDGDGADDALVGAPGDTSGGVDAGAVWLFDSEAL